METPDNPIVSTVTQLEGRMTAVERTMQTLSDSLTRFIEQSTEQGKQTQEDIRHMTEVFGKQRETDMRELREMSGELYATMNKREREIRDRLSPKWGVLAAWATVIITVLALLGGMWIAPLTGEMKLRDELLEKKLEVKIMQLQLDGRTNAVTYQPNPARATP